MQVEDGGRYGVMRPAPPPPMHLVFFSWARPKTWPNQVGLNPIFYAQFLGLVGFFFSKFWVKKTRPVPDSIFVADHKFWLKPRKYIGRVNSSSRLVA